MVGRHLEFRRERVAYAILLLGIYPGTGWGRYSGLFWGPCS